MKLTFYETDLDKLYRKLTILIIRAPIRTKLLLLNGRFEINKLAVS